MHGIFADDEVIHRCILSGPVLHNIQLQMHFLIVRILPEQYLDITRLDSEKGAVRSIPRLWDSPSIMGMSFGAPFFKKRRSPLEPESSRTLIALFLASSPLRAL
jgi:hypothetical protein